MTSNERVQHKINELEVINAVLNYLDLLEGVNKEDPLEGVCYSSIIEEEYHEFDNEGNCIDSDYTKRDNAKVAFRNSDYLTAIESIRQGLLKKI